MKTIQTISLLTLLAFIYSCSDKKPDNIKPKYDNHIYFLAIGNAHYEKDVASGINYFPDVAEANTSADIVSERLSAFGTGITLKSSAKNLLSREVIFRYVDSIVAKAVKDSLSTTYIYYCGHGFTDKEKNVFLVPGAHQFQTKDDKSLETLVSVNEIQTRIMDAVAKHYSKAKISKEEMKHLTESMYNQDSENPEKFIKEANQRSQERSRYLKNQAKKFKVPHFIIMADCCTNPYDVVNYDMFLGDEDKGGQKERDQVLNMIKNMPPAMREQYMKTLGADIIKMGTLKPTAEKMGFWMGGNRTVYTGELGKSAKTRSLPGRKEKVGPICRRLVLFFDQHQDQFMNAQLLTALCSASFDKESVPAKFEIADGSKMFSGDATGTKGTLGDLTTKVTDDSFLSATDSIQFTANTRR